MKTNNPSLSCRRRQDILVSSIVSVTPIRRITSSDILVRVCVLIIRLRCRCWESFNCTSTNKSLRKNCWKYPKHFDFFNIFMQFIHCNEKMGMSLMNIFHVFTTLKQLLYFTLLRQQRKNFMSYEF